MCGTPSTFPPDEYWSRLEKQLPGPPLEEVRSKIDRGSREIRPEELPGGRERLRRLLTRVTADGWLREEIRHYCPECGCQLTAEEAQGELCPDPPRGCGNAFVDSGGVREEVAYRRDVDISRTVRWVLVLHGMNTAGGWQEDFTWMLARSYGRSVPVAVYKYGKVRPGAILRFRQRQLVRQLTERIRRYSGDAEGRGFGGKPDVVAHSFGTWLLAEALWDNPDLQVGRVILLGSIVEPGFDWPELMAPQEGQGAQVEAVLNHFGTWDGWSAVAHYVIPGSGPSGCRGFDSDSGVLNARARGFTHSRFFRADTLEGAYEKLWRPFLTLPEGQLGRLPDLYEAPTRWRPTPWPLRATLAPPLALVTTAAGLSWAVAGLGGKAARCKVPLKAACLAGLGGLLTLAGSVVLWEGGLKVLKRGRGKKSGRRAAVTPSSAGLLRRPEGPAAAPPAPGVSRADEEAQFTQSGDCWTS